MYKPNKICSLLLAGTLFLSPLYSSAQESTADILSEDIMPTFVSDLSGNDLSDNATTDATDLSDNDLASPTIPAAVHNTLSLPETLRHVDISFSLGTTGYYIINGADMVSDGARTVYGLEDGIHATAHGIKRTCKVTVEDPTFQINQSSMILYRGYNGTITATPVPDTAVKWSSSNNKVATVSSTGKVTAIKAGTATITATAHGIKRTCTVTVKEPKLSVSVPSNTLRIGQSANLRVTVDPIAPVTYRSLNPNIVEVNPQGRMTARSPGTARIEVSANNLTKYVIIYVK